MAEKPTMQKPVSDTTKSQNLPAGGKGRYHAANVTQASSTVIPDVSSLDSDEEDEEETYAALRRRRLKQLKQAREQSPVDENFLFELMDTNYAGVTQEERREFDDMLEKRAEARMQRRKAQPDKKPGSRCECVCGQHLSTMFAGPSSAAAFTQDNIPGSSGGWTANRSYQA